MKVVKRRTGLTADAIRVWEKRYGAVVPQRTKTNRRIYSDSDIERLQMLRRLTEAGHSIGRIAGLSDERLQDMLKAEHLTLRSSVPAPDLSVSDPEEIRVLCRKAVEDWDVSGLESTLAGASVSLSQPVWLEEVVLPLMKEIGEMWRQGSARIAQEHMATAVVRSLLGSIRASFDWSSSSAPVLVLTTPSGQLHELGALIAGVTAAADGWRVVYLGPNLPAEEIAGVAQKSNVDAVGLSILYPPDDPHTHMELQRLRTLLPESVPIIIGGTASESYSATLKKIGAIHTAEMSVFREVLSRIRFQQGKQTGED